MNKIIHFSFWHSSPFYIHLSGCHPCALWDRTLGPVSWVCCRFIQLALEAPLTAFGPAQPLTANVSRQFQSWCFSCQPCSLPAFEASIVPKGCIGLSLPNSKSIKSVLSNGTDYFIILFSLCTKCSWILPFNPTWLEFVFILCCFLGMHCLCAAVVCYSDTWFLFNSLAGIRGDEETMLATHHHPTTVHFSRPWSCVHLQKGMVQENAGNLKPGYVLRHGTLNAGS